MWSNYHSLLAFPLMNPTVHIISNHPQLAYLHDLLREDVASTLKNGEAFTLFLPIDKSWEALHPYERQYLESEFSKDDLFNIVGMHALAAKHVKWSDKFGNGANCMLALLSVAAGLIQMLLQSPLDMGTT
jgi:hypothetical protein